MRRMLDSPEMVFLMEAHDGLSARIAESEGFDALWASGFSISTSLGLRDSDEASWSQLLSVVEYMVAGTSVPIVVDGDTGYGNFNTARRFLASAERQGAAGVCFEDKVFPKMNSFVGDSHRLADIDEFAAKIAACSEARNDEDFCIIARTEALIAGRGVDEALERAEAYRKAGATAIFVHSRQQVADEIEQFAAEWADRAPLVIAPTTYASTSADTFRNLGISAVIWANHSMRAAVTAMRDVCRSIKASESVLSAEAKIASLKEIFEFMDYAEIEETERRLLLRGTSAADD